MGSDAKCALATVLVDSVEFRRGLHRGVELVVVFDFRGFFPTPELAAAGTQMWPGVRLSSHRGEWDGCDGTGMLRINVSGVRMSAAAVR